MGLWELIKGTASERLGDSGQNGAEPGNKISGGQEPLVGQTLGTPTGTLKGYISKDVILPERFGNYSDILDDNTLSQEQKAAEIKKRGEAERGKYERDLDMWKLKHRTGTAIQIGSGLIPLGIGGRLGVGLSSKLAPFLGKNIAKHIANGVTSEAVGGGIGGLGEGLLNDENLLKSIIKGTTTGGAQGGMSGAVTGFAGKTPIGRKLSEHILFKDINKEQIKKFSNRKPSAKGIESQDEMANRLFNLLKKQ